MRLPSTVRRGIDAVFRRYRQPHTQENFHHDFSIDFDVSEPLPANAISTLVCAAAALRKSGITAIVAEGTLLGLVRDGALIAHDTDLDLYVIGTSTASKIVQCLEAEGWTVGQHARIGSVSSHITLFDSERVLLDLTLFEHIGDLLMSFKERDGYLAIDAEIVLPPTSLPGFSNLMMPSQPEAFLQAYYGSDWRVPKSNKTFWKDDYCGIFVRGIADIVAARRKALDAVSQSRGTR